MPPSSRTRLARLIALCALLTLAVGSVALARAGASGKVTIDSHKIGSATGKCPRGTGVIAGGFGSPDFSPDFSPGNNQAGVARIGSQRVGKRKLRTTAYNFGDEAGVLNSIAYCSRAGRRVRVASSKVFIGPRSAGVAVATCPGSSRVVGGGFASPGFSAASAPRVLTLTSKRFGPNQWRVEAFNMGDDDDDNNSSDPHPGTLIAYAYCLDDAPRIVVRHRRVAAGLRGTAKTFKVRCPRRMRALSGGFDGNLYLSANARASGAIISKRASKGRAWRFTALSIAERSAKSSGYAYCVPRRG